MSKTAKIILLTNGVIIAILLITGGVFWYKYSQIYVKMGFAEAKFPYRVYSVEEMGKMYPQEPLEGIETTQTPEQTHAKFISALKKGDIDGAVECCVLKSSQEKMVDKLNAIKDKDMFMIMLKDIETANFQEFKNLDMESRINVEFYGVEDNKKIGALMTFQKNLDGVWLIESF